MFRLIFLFSCIPLIFSQCTNGVVGSNNVCYKAYNQLATWYAAEASCAKLGGHLPSISDAFLNANLQKYAAGTFNSIDYWIGLTTNFLGSQWAWSDYSTYSYNDWGTGKPINTIGYCASQLLSNSIWVNSTCTTTKPYICAFENPCPPGWYHYDGRIDNGYNKCHYLVNKNNKYESKLNYTWQEANDYCKKYYNGSMSSIHNGIENWFFTALVKQYMGDYWAWLGLQRSMIDVNDFVWADGTNFNYDEFSSIPSNFSCSHLDAINREWYLRACDDTHGINGWFCEIDAAF